jgi:hypothetical protein
MNTTSEEKGETDWVENRFDGKKYLVSIIPVQKTFSVPNVLQRNLSDDTENSFLTMFADALPEAENFNHVCYEAAIFSEEPPFSKPLFLIVLNDFQPQLVASSFKKLVHSVIENEEINNLTLWKEGEEHIFDKYGFKAVSVNSWQALISSELRIVIISKKGNYMA